ncbi:GxxExxY protein [Candidatus Shapirobacteria bacterium CG10_big_fil_rev_8_21_14_0_10_40_9]|uniref:GxxExxY protein n=1 Tax=Candidatus Shapirobacteria bacterium CG10_big_fil_rev_8_21_14_0_10_40_9 TaxID=1974888 RepID=A0A2M8L399_9BACT|nr:MAG: GxxExxY protein [Candidatus Shapirobacteria bacterium CG10_big_fil_rev_8_21_14_0_10_40_9]
MKNTNLTDKLLHKDLSYRVVGCIYEVRNKYGSGQKEPVYQNALAEEFEKKKIPFKREVSIRILSLDTGKSLGNYRLDFIIDEKIVVEAKAMTYTPAKIANQLYSYLRSTTYEVGYLVNFGSTNLYIKRVILTNDRKKQIRSIRNHSLN